MKTADTDLVNIVPIFLDSYPGNVYMARRIRRQGLSKIKSSPRDFHQRSFFGGRIFHVFFSQVIPSGYYPRLTLSGAREVGGGRDLLVGPVQSHEI